MFTSSLAPLCPSLPSGLSSFFLSIFLPCIEFEFIHEPDKTRSLAASWYASIMDIDEERGEGRQTLKRKKEEERVKRVRGKEAAAEEERGGGGGGGGAEETSRRGPAAVSSNLCTATAPPN